MSFLDTLIGNDTINFLCQLMIFVVIVPNLLKVFKGYKKGTNYFVLWIALTLYSVFYSPIDGDNYTSLVNYYAYRDGVLEDYLHFEPIYFRIMDIVPYSYVAWRFFIWGIGSLLLVLYTKWMKFDISVTTVSILYFSLPLLFYQRAIIGYVLVYIGITLLSNAVLNNTIIVTRIRNVLIGIVCLLGSLSFHTTMIFYVSVAVLSLAFVLLSPKRHALIILLVIMVLSSRSLPNLIDFFIENASEETQYTAEHYLENAKLGATPTVFGYIALLVKLVPYYGMLLYCMLNIGSKVLSFTLYEKSFLINSFVLVLISIFFSSISVSIEGKFYTASLLPWGLFLASFFTRMRDSKVARLFIKVCIAAFIFLQGINVLSALLSDLI